MKLSIRSMFFTMLGGVVLFLATTPSAAQTDILLQLRSGSPPGARFNLDPEASDKIDLIVGAAGAPGGHVKVFDGRTNTAPGGHVKVLEAQTSFYSSVTIIPTKREVLVKFEGSVPLKSPVNGQAVKWTREDGAKFELKSWIENGSLVQTLTSKDQTITRTFTIQGSTLKVQIVDSSLSRGPLTYKLVYNRAS